MKPPTPEEFEAITKLAGELLAVKARESAAKADRWAIEAKLAALIPCAEEGQRTIRLPDKTGIVIVRGLAYKMDADAIRELMTNPEYPPPIVSKATHTLDVAGYKWYRENHPDIFSALARHVEVKPKKVSVTVKAPK